MNLSLPPDIVSLVERAMRVGKYQSVDDAIRAGLFMLLQTDRLECLPAEELEAIIPGFREKVAAGLADAEAGRFSDGEAFFDELERADVQATDPARKTA